MKKDWYNREGYFDPTCGEAMERADRELRARRAAKGRKLDKDGGAAYTDCRL